MNAEVRTYGGGRYVKHWILYVNERFIGDTSIPSDGELFNEIADRLNESEPVRATDRIRAAAEGAAGELREQAAAWITVAPILEAHTYEPREDGHVWNAYTRWNRGSQAVAIAKSLRAALAADREPEPVTDDRAPEGGRPDYVQRMRELAESVGERNERIRTLREEWPVRITDEMVERAARAIVSERYGLHARIANLDRRYARCALAAALSGPPPEGESE